MTKYKRFMASVRHLRDYRKQNTRPAVVACIDGRSRANDGIELDLHSALLALLPRIRRFAMALTHSTVDAEALVQAAYDRAMSRKARFRTDPQLLARMYRVMSTCLLARTAVLKSGGKTGRMPPATSQARLRSAT